MADSSSLRPVLAGGFAVALLLAVLFLLTRGAGPDERPAAELDSVAAAPEDAPARDLLPAAALPEQRVVPTAPDLQPDPEPESEPEPAEPTPPAELKLPRFQPIVEGLVLAEALDGGEPVAGAFVAVTIARRFASDQLYRGLLDGLPLATARTDSAGRFSIQLPIPETETLVDVHVYAHGFLPDTVRSAWADLGAVDREPRIHGFVLSRGETYRAQLVLPDDLTEGERTWLELFAAPDSNDGDGEPQRADLISVSDEWSLGGIYPAWTDSFRKGVRAEGRDENGVVEFTGWTRGQGYWLHSRHPGFVVDQRRPVLAGGGIESLRVIRRPHLTFRFERSWIRSVPWRVEFDLELIGDGPNLPLEVRSREGGLLSTTSEIDLSLLPETLGVEIDPSKIDLVSGTVTATLDPLGELGRPDLEQYLEQVVVVGRSEEGLVVELDPEAFETRDTRGAVARAACYDQELNPVSDADLTWRTVIGTTAMVLPEQLLGSPSLEFAKPRFPTRIHTSTPFADRFFDWEAGYRDGRVTWSGSQVFLCPRPGTLRVREVEPEHPIRLAWRDRGGGEHTVWEGLLGVFEEDVPMPTGVWVLSSQESSRRRRVRIEPGEAMVTVF